MIQVAKLSWANMGGAFPLVLFWEWHKEKKYTGMESSLTDAEDWKLLFS